jgi:NADH-quinone oxidoreductase subunit C
VDFFILIGYFISVAKLRTTFAPTPLAAVKTVVGEVGACPPLADIKSKAEAAGFKLELIEAAPSDPFFKVKADDLVGLLKWIRDDLNLEFNFLQVVSAVDFVEKAATEDSPAVRARMELLYVLYSFPLRAYLNVKVELPRENPQINTVAHLFRAANWYERECYDMMGIKFIGHPHLERILLPSDWVGHPLKKDYVYPEEYNGMKVPL